MTWSKEAIQQARKTHLLPILREKGYAFKNREFQNVVLQDYGELVVKNHYWIWKNTNQSGNAIDFFMKIEKKSFNETMHILTQKKYEASECKIKKSRSSKNLHNSVNNHKNNENPWTSIKENLRS